MEKETRSKPKILVVDDESQNLRLMEAMLHPLGYEVAVARDGDEALTKVGELPPDVILLDIMMPKMDGFEVARRLKENDETKIIPIVMVTALMEVKERVKALEVGADDFLSKPVDKVELRARVNSLLKVKAYNDHMRNYQQELEAEVAKRTEQLRQAMEELCEIDRKKSEFISNISHELRTPVQSIKGFSELMLAGQVPDPERQKEFLTIISAGSDRLSRLIGNLLNVSHLEVGYSEVQKERVSIRGFLQEAISDLHSPAEQKDIAISAEIPAVLPEMEVDGERLKQVMHNLLHNAIKFSPGGGTITVGAEVRDRNLLVQVIDRGVGIAQEAMPRVFEKFYQTEDAAKVEGLGLGLYISKQIIEAHGGRIWATSKIGEGSTFSFTLPLGQAGGDSHTQKGERPLQGEKR